GGKTWPCWQPGAKRHNRPMRAQGSVQRYDLSRLVATLLLELLPIANQRYRGRIAVRLHSGTAALQLTQTGWLPWAWRFICKRKESAASSFSCDDNRGGTAECLFLC